MANLITVIRSRVAGQLARDRLKARFTAQQETQDAQVAGNQLVRVGSMFAPANTTEDMIGGVVAVVNAGRPAAAVYAVQGGVEVVNLRGGSTSTGTGAGAVVGIWPITVEGGYRIGFDATAIGRPYATIVIAAANCKAVGASNANYVCAGANDQTVIQAAIDSLGIFGGMVLLLDGDYYLSGKITLNSGCILMGMGQATTILHLTAAAARIDGGGIEDCAIAQLHLQCVGANHAIHLQLAEQCLLADLTITDALKDGIHIDRAIRCSVRGLRISGCGRDGIRLVVASSSEVRNNRVATCAGAGIRIGAV